MDPTVPPWSRRRSDRGACGARPARGPARVAANNPAAAPVAIISRRESASWV
jgi:hypothetical protein